MKCDKHTMLLYAVTDRAWVGEQTLYQQVESALKGGATCVQLREKHLDDADFLQEAIEIHALCPAVRCAAVHQRQRGRSREVPRRGHPCGAGRYGPPHRCASAWARI